MFDHRNLSRLANFAAVVEDSLGSTAAASD